jgi:hypothetical protein
MATTTILQDSPKTISVCVVTYNSDQRVLGTTLSSLAEAVRPVENTIVQICLVNNASSSLTPPHFNDDGKEVSVQMIQGHGNIGFGRGHNLALDTVGDYHLVLNPDVEMAPDALQKALVFMEAHPECGLLTPLVYGTDGKRQFLCKRFPAVLDLALRGFAPSWLQQLFKTRLDRYQMAEMSENAVFWDPPIVSGCFMLFRGDVFKALNGFDPDYFLYFEDFDLSLRTAQIGRIAFVPQVRIIHGGGYASRKGAWHIWQFLKSGLTFYSKFGLKLW